MIWFSTAQGTRISMKLVLQEQSAVNKHTEKGAVIKNRQMWLIRKLLPRPREGKLSNLEVAEFIVEHEIKSETELLAVANGQSEEGKKDLADFVLSRNSKGLHDLIEQTWKMKTASATLQRKKASRIDLIWNAADGECSLSCDGKWLECAQEVLVNNKVHPILFAAAVRELLLLGRGKYRNVMIVGPTNCGKTFLLRPLELIFKIFSNPAADRYAWVGAEHAEIIFLNDLRWSKELIEWKSFLLLLEGDRVNLPAPSAPTFASVKIRQYLQPQRVSSGIEATTTLKTKSRMT